MTDITIDIKEPRSFLDRPLVYVAGPYTSNPVKNTSQTIIAASILQDTGLVTCIVPHLSLFWDVIRYHTTEHWLAYDMALLARCDALLRLPGESPGSEDEVIYASDQLIPVFYNQKALLSWARAWLRRSEQ